jgi:hypothetical protein
MWSMKIKNKTQFDIYDTPNNEKMPLLLLVAIAVCL